MLRSSLGFHTMTLSMVLPQLESKQLIQDFMNYRRDTGVIKIYENKYSNLVVKYKENVLGIEWLIRKSVWLNKFNLWVDIVEVTINPKILGGVFDYITAANIDDMDRAMANFNSISETISPLLRTFDEYSFKRIDYCVNFYLPELFDQNIKPCTDAQIIKLIKRSDIPSPYKEWLKYDEKAHRAKSGDGSFYLKSKNNSVRINCYSKFMQLIEQSNDNLQKGYPPISQEILDAAQGIIRFEVQCDYHKTYALTQKAKSVNGKIK